MLWYLGWAVKVVRLKQRGGKGEHTRWWKNSKQNYRSRRQHGPSGQMGYDLSVQEEIEI